MENPVDDAILVDGINPQTGQPTQPQWQPTKPQGALNQVPPTFNLQSGIGYQFHIKRLPNVNFFVNRVNTPGVSLPPAIEHTPFIIIPKPGDHIIYEPLVLNFLIDEGLNNYFELQKWLATIAGRRGGRAYGELAKNPEYTGHGVMSEILVSILNAQKNVIRTITYHDAWPTSLTKLDHDAQATAVPYLDATATFLFTDYDTSTNT
jgi:hypothetical protein